MRLILISLLTLITLACGKQVISMNIPTSTSALKTQTGILSIPLPSANAGGTTLNYESQELQLGKLSTEAQASLQIIVDGQAKSTPVSSDSLTVKYNVYFIGTVGTGACSSSPSSSCKVMDLQSLTAY